MSDNKRRFKSRAEYEAYIEARKRQRLEQLNNPKFQPPADYQAPYIPARKSSDEHHQFQRPQPQIIYQQSSYNQPPQQYRNIEHTPGIEFHGQPKLKIGGMKFRRAFFWFLALLMLCQMCYLLTTIFTLAGNSVSGQTSYTQTPEGMTGLFQDITVLGLTGIFSYVAIVCSGMLFLMFALLAWRNGAGIRQARLNHQQLMMMYQTRYSVYNPSYDRDDPYGY